MKTDLILEFIRTGIINDIPFGANTTRMTLI
jgi:hypothetical protein